MDQQQQLSRRSALKSAGVAGAAAFLGGVSPNVTANEPPKQPSDLRQQIFSQVWKTPLIDTHEHLCEEKDRLAAIGRSDVHDDWSVVLAGYLGSDLITAGMPRSDYGRFYSQGPSPAEKWNLLAAWWPAVKNTGYGRAARISLRELYGVDDLSEGTVDKVRNGYEKLRQRGFYRQVLEMGGIESCQVNSSNPPFIESELPTILMQDLSIVGMFAGPELGRFAEPTGIKVSNLSDWHRVIDWWFDKYGRYSVAVKSQNAYSRDIDYRQVTAEEVETSFAKRVEGQPLTPDEQKAIEDHLFWYAVRKATEHDLPVKLHTGYYAGDNRMPLARLIHNAGSACELCRAAPQTQFVFMHICYPYYEELISVAKQYTNACVDMCWGWIINPVASKDFLKKYLVTAPANKILTFGGDYRFVEQTLGHALIARQGIALALSELVEEGWLSVDDALELIDPIMHGNARRIFRLPEKEPLLRAAPWV